MKTILDPCDASSNQEPPREIQDQLLERLNGITMFSSVASEALEHANSPECSIPEFCRIIERDVPLATNALALANSAFYSQNKPTSSLKQAVVRLGMRECKNLILTTCISSLMKTLPLEAQWTRDILQQHSVATATLCAYLNRVLDIGFHGEEYAAGLLHDIGRLLLATLDGERFASCDDLSFENEMALLEKERDCFGTDHCQLGAWYATREGLPTPLLDAARSHHSPETALGNNTLVALVAAGDDLANHLQRTGEACGYDPAGNKAISILAELIGPSIEGRFVDMAEVMLNDGLCDLPSFDGGVRS